MVFLFLYYSNNCFNYFNLNIIDLFQVIFTAMVLSMIFKTLDGDEDNIPNDVEKDEENAEDAVIAHGRN